MLFNGGISGNFTVHFCYVRGCCGDHSFETCLNRMMCFFAKTVFGQVASDLPAVTRWYTFLPHLCRQSMGSLLFRMLPRVAAVALKVVYVEDEDSYQGTCNKKKKTALEFLGPPSVGAVIGLLTFTSK